MPDVQLAILVVVGFVALKICELAIDKWFKKTVDTEYRTVIDCRMCREQCLQQRTSGMSDMQGNIRDLGKSIDLLRGILLVLAVRVGVEEDTLSKLASRGDGK